MQSIMLVSSLFQPPSNWPKDGVVKYDRVRMQYRPGLPYALDGVSFCTVPGERLGIVGRTGSGKSSLFLTLFRMMEIQEGVITVDGVDLRHLDLKDIRCAPFVKCVRSLVSEFTWKRRKKKEKKRACSMLINGTLIHFHAFKIPFLSGCRS